MALENPRPTQVRLNRYLAMAGVASRRTAVKLIKNGLVTVNGQTVKEPGTLVDLEKDTVTYKGKALKPEKPVYILLNKPKNTLCTVKDPQQRPTVLDLLAGAPPVRLYPAGRLDRNTTGILLLTNDGELAQKLLHPSTKVPRTYRVTSVKPFTQAIVESLLRGVILEEGIAKADEAYMEDSYTLIITVHIGWKHVVRRMLEKLGYRVKSLDRIAFGPIKRKGVPRGGWRFLTSAEVGWLYMAAGLTPQHRLPKLPRPFPPPTSEKRPSKTPKLQPRQEGTPAEKASHPNLKRPARHRDQPTRKKFASSSHADSHRRHPRRGSQT